ncbi:hypothetical protein SJAG_02537 [Schizosaccharomyces japonicus yFS275]|uniref:Membrane transporter n=1 Tax=Schizosaccharomyces japonicus (strain yFS275 / FY16936) TaxID=402676 RepID=B6K0I1_SCHJY|nr:hypothetical protein SJAG_02537 [Schizosaccharomyces japonicus yFS275]EEB07452.1 hypothetical protein SJAG_02537 [Schizosaccharomyces japonicus yFS275]
MSSNSTHRLGLAIVTWFTIQNCCQAFVSVSCIQLIQYLLAEYHDVPRSEVGRRVAVVCAQSCILQYLLSVCSVPFHSRAMKRFGNIFTLFSTWIGFQLFFGISLFALKQTQLAKYLAYVYIFGIAITLGSLGMGPSLNTAWRNTAVQFHLGSGFTIMMSFSPFVSTFAGSFIGSGILMRWNLHALYMLTWSLHLFDGGFLLYIRKKFNECTRELMAEGALLTSKEEEEEEEEEQGNGDNAVTQPAAEHHVLVTLESDESLGENTRSTRLPVTQILILAEFFFFVLFTSFSEQFVQYELDVLSFSLVKAGFINGVQSLGALTGALYTTMYLRNASSEVLLRTTTFCFAVQMLGSVGLAWNHWGTLFSGVFSLGLALAIGPTVVNLLIVHYFSEAQSVRMLRAMAWLEGLGIFSSYMVFASVYLITSTTVPTAFFLLPFCLALVGVLISMKPAYDARQVGYV